MEIRTVTKVFFSEEEKNKICEVDRYFFEVFMNCDSEISENAKNIFDSITNFLDKYGGEDND